MARGRHHPAPIGCQSGVTVRALSSILGKQWKSIFYWNRPYHFEVAPLFRCRVGE